MVKQAKEIAQKYVSAVTNIIDQKTLETVAIYQDTDSCYVSFKLLNLNFSEAGKVTQETHDHVKALEDMLNVDIEKYAVAAFNSKDPRFVFKREAIADVGLFLEKKRYVLHVLDDEGIHCDKWKYTGVEVVRTSMPKVVKPHVKNIIETMLSTRSLAATNKALTDTYDVFNKLPIEDISRTSGIKGYEKYASLCNDFKIAKRTPNHVKAAYYHNLLIDKLGLDRKYTKISSGEKIKYFYVEKPNKYGIDCIGYKNKFPEEFKAIFSPDKEVLFEKIVYAAVEKFYEAVSWTPRKPSQQVQCELFDIFGD